MKKLVRLLVVLALIAALVFFWLNLDLFGIHASLRFYLVGGGASALVVGLLLKLLGRWDVIPDWFPLIGKADDNLAWILMATGLGAGLVGYFLL
ncbi:MAG: hypothetical protein JXB32_08905 [Deltaproteobacteria bacterium]|nr:hypothetical protein [Deltaproteobacteria bacterium]